MGIIFGFGFIQIAQSVPWPLSLSPCSKLLTWLCSLLLAPRSMLAALSSCSLQNSNYVIAVKSIQVGKGIAPTAGGAPRKLIVIRFELKMEVDPKFRGREQHSTNLLNKAAALR
jgi:hypothetical protein